MIVNRILGPKDTTKASTNNGDFQASTNNVSGPSSRESRVSCSSAVDLPAWEDMSPLNGPPIVAPSLSLPTDHRRGNRTSYPGVPPDTPVDL